MGSGSTLLRRGRSDTAILSPGTQDIIERQVPLQRLGRPEEVASLIYFLSTQSASYVNGAKV
nr:SDR family oxidoreductase [Sodalis-like endosymbiont of Proechinophthirus fluctus]